MKKNGFNIKDMDITKWHNIISNLKLGICIIN